MTAFVAGRGARLPRRSARPADGSDIRRTCAATVQLLVVAVVAVVAGAAATWVSMPNADATTGAGLAARARTIAATVVADDASIQALGERYLSEHAVFAAASAEALTLHRDIARVSSYVAVDRTQVLEAAVSAYVTSGSDNGLTLLLDGNAGTLAAGQTYLRVASDALGAAVTRLRDDEHHLDISLSIQRHVATSAAQALHQTDVARARVIGTVATERTLLAHVNGQLAVLVRAQELARERALALAQQAVARAAAERAAAAATAAAAAAAAAAKSSAGSTGSTTTTTTTAGANSSGGTSGSAGPPAPSGTPPPGTSAIPSGTLSQDFATIRNCESSDDYSLDTGNGYYGAYQFSLGTWQGLGGAGLPSAAAPAIQDAKAYELYLGSGWSSWPECAAIAGLA